MALHQLFTLAFALHLEPLPTLDYAAVPYVRDSTQNSASLQEPDKLRVGANTKLEPIHTRHFPHSVDTLSFLINHTRALDAVEPFSKLIGLLNEADEDPEFRNLRDFFDARYDTDGTLVGAEKEPSRRVRSISRAASTKQSTRRPSHATEGRKSSFAASLGGATALKLNWLRRNNTSDSQPHEASDDEDTHSRMSSSGHTFNPPPPSAPYIRLLRRHTSGLPASSASSSVHHSHPRSSDQDASTVVNFRVRLDLHSVGLAPAPPRLRAHRQPDASTSGLHRSGSAKSAKSVASADWRRRRARNSSLSGGGAALRPVVSPDSSASLDASSAAANGDSDQHSGFSRLALDTDTGSAVPDSTSLIRNRPPPSSGVPGPAANMDNNLSSITEGAAASPEQPSSPTTAGKPGRRPSMMSKLLDFGRKKSFLDRPTNDAIDSRSASPGPPYGDEPSGTHAALAATSATAHPSNFRSGLRQELGDGHHLHEEALELDEDDDEGALRAQMMHQPLVGDIPLNRRRSSADSSAKQQAGPKHNPHDLRPVQEDGLLDLTMVPTGSSISTSLSDRGIAEESLGGDTTATGTNKSSVKTQRAPVMDGGDFLSLLRAASNLGLASIADFLETSDTSMGVSETPNGGDVATPCQDDSRPPNQRSDHVTDTGSTNTPRVYPKRTSLPATPGKSVRSLDLDRSPAPSSSASNPIDASFKLGASLTRKNGGEKEEAWWPCGDVDPLPISLSSALGQALGWEGIMHLCYGKGSRAATEGDYVALGKAAAIDQANKTQERSVQAWRTGVASAGASPPKTDTLHSLIQSGAADTAGLIGDLTQKLNLDPANPVHDITSDSSQLQRLEGQAFKRSSTVPQTGEIARGTSRTNDDGAGSGWGQSELLLGTKVNHSRTWQHWQELFKSIKGWVDEYEQTRVRSGLAREIGLDQLVEQTPSVGGTAGGETSITLSAPTLIEAPNEQAESSDLHIPLTIGSPPALHTEVLKVARDRVDASTLSKVLGTSLSISPCVLADATNRAHGFRRRAGIPEGLPLGPEDEETVDYSWSRKKLSVEHFATALTVSCDSALHYFGQLSTSNWLFRSAWELDYLEMCVFKSPLVAERFPPPGAAVVPASQSYRAAEGTKDRARLCPNPDETGAWNPDTWKRWLASIREGDIIVPAVAWQAWWTLISVLNGADRTGRCYDLQVKTPEEPFEALTDLNAVFL